MKQKNWLVPVRAGVFVAFLLIICLVSTHYFFPDLFPYHTNAQSEATAELKEKLTELERLWSVIEPDSDIYAVNHSDGQACLYGLGIPIMARQKVYQPEKPV